MALELRTHICYALTARRGFQECKLVVRAGKVGDRRGTAGILDPPHEPCLSQYEAAIQKLPRTILYPNTAIVLDIPIVRSPRKARRKARRYLQGS
ncbi:uncharacterized protein N7487_012191 [Penicillium crustosum]|uniref:uncharacterized protein n=1 Tax=Penicillium crustosum TaxID=36656 RepID=UPI002384E3F9|nr:uncharacterized protein N7487_012191 [Penicillium crustosum]KAJ5394550.1 hypothetical protein N7487_012191 [Penicillium crustosum]